ncbi:dihydrofolate reductase family protein [Spirillospora sp. NPDC047279]|uniref:dihydrofolate reductase family protein n=1 Tax=Spirillospora sp. NPDC047279 TaxID=3155478 RepID=UPI0033FF5660
MAKIVNSTFVSLDGVVNHMEKWHFDYLSDQGDQLAPAQLEEADAMLMGRDTYEVYAGAWPSRDGDYADRINAIPKYVASSTLSDPTWHGTQVLAGVGDENDVLFEAGLHTRLETFNVQAFDNGVVVLSFRKPT